ncbi:MAG TPA: capsule assembly Wzi family protein [Gammaproteobacteria bacterium]|nr:capsule assembly Wzi family protein [Gammaproteobacteria bacterium]
MDSMGSPCRSRSVAVALALAVAVSCLWPGAAAHADMLLAPGSPALRSDLQMLADAGVLEIPVDTWPIPWSAIGSRLAEVDPARLPPAEAAAYDDVMAHAPAGLRGAVDLAAQSAYPGLRWFRDSPRGRATLGASMQDSGPHLSWKLAGQAVRDAPDGHAARPDGSYLGVNLGNWMLSAGAVDRWWGPGWGGGLILSSNARPIPGVTLRRRRPDAFHTPWLSWIGPWRLLVFGGETGTDRVVPHAKVFGMRVSFRPVAGLTIGLSRTALWGGQGRPESLHTFERVLLGKTNTLSQSNNPADELAGADARWAFRAGRPMAVYGEIIGEDQAAHLPWKDIAQVGWSTWGALGGDGSRFRVFLEYADTTTRYYNGAPLYGVAYDHSVYRTGYRFHGMPIGYPTDNDSRLGTAGWLTMVPGLGTISLLGRYGQINRSGNAHNTVSAVPEHYGEVRLGWQTPAGRWGRLELAVGATRRIPDGAPARSHGLGWVEWKETF